MAAPGRLFSTVQLRITLSDLPRMDVLSKTDAFCIVNVKAGGVWTTIGNTETRWNEQSPSFAQVIAMQYRFEEVQELSIVVWDHDEFTRHDYIGQFETTVGRLMGAKGCALAGRLRHQATGVDRGGIILSGTEAQTGDRDMLRIQFSGHKLDKKDWFGKSDPYLVFVKPTGDEVNAWRSRASPAPAAVLGSYSGQRQRLWAGPVMPNTLDPQWPIVEIPIASMCGCVPDSALPPGAAGGGAADPGNRADRVAAALRADPRMTSCPLIIECYDHNKNSTHEIIGETQVITLQDLLLSAPGAAGAAGGGAAGMRRWALANPKKNGKQAGELSIATAMVTRQPSLLEYIAGGTQMQLTVGVDFTGSNGNPTDPRSLHWLDARPGAPLNAYGAAIAAVGDILLEYDSDKMVPAFGFGATTDGGRSTSHCFPLTLNPGQVEVFGVEGMLGAYRHALLNVGLSGPTHFAPIIRQAISQACTGGPATQQNQNYSIFLLLTDGQMNDVDSTIEAIVDASNGEGQCASTGPAPLSIVIVGVGNADFSAMEVLDGDDGKLRDYAGRIAKRDIVQFVPFNKFASLPDGGARLAAEVLAEIPGQLVSFFASRGIMPNPPLPPGSLRSIPLQQAPGNGQQQQQMVPSSGAAVAVSVPMMAAVGGGGYPPVQQQQQQGMMMAPPGIAASGYNPQQYPPQQQQQQAQYPPSYAGSATGAASMYPPVAPAAAAVAVPLLPASGATGGFGMAGLPPTSQWPSKGGPAGAGAVENHEADPQ